jgi:hypothetical protein
MKSKENPFENSCIPSREIAKKLRSAAQPNLFAIPISYFRGGDNRPQAATADERFRRGFSAE